MKKRLLALVMAGVMVMGMSMTVFAEVPVPETNKDATVEGEVAEAYTITIPATINDTTAGTISIDGRLAPGKQAFISVAADDIKLNRLDKDGALEAEGTNNFYNVKLLDASNNDSPIMKDTAIVTLINSTKGETTIKSSDDNKTETLLAGKYQGKVTFKITYGAITTQP